MTDETFLFDTYAILDVINGNTNYQPYLNSGIIINDFIFAELCYKLLRENQSKANYYLEKYKDFISHTDSSVIKEAMFFRVKHKKKKLSMTDCISYIMAIRLGIKFLTGDKEFEKFESVEFVK